MGMITESALALLEADNRLLNPVYKDKTRVTGRYGFRGELALKQATLFADEKRPPEISADQVIAIAQAGEHFIPFFACYLHSFEYLKLVAEVLGERLHADGKYFLFCNNIDLAAKYQVSHGEATFYVLPIDEATVYNEMLELLRLEKGDLKKLDTAGKIDAVANAALGFSDKYPKISFEEGLKIMGPVRNRGEYRPV